MSKPNATDYVSLVEIADMVGVTRARAFQLAATTAFPSPVILVGRRRIWRRADVQEWIGAHRAAA